MGAYHSPEEICAEVVRLVREKLGVDVQAYFLRQYTTHGETWDVTVDGAHDHERKVRRIVNELRKRWAWEAPMTRELHTAEEIQAEVDRLLNAGRKVPITVPLPHRLALDSDPFDVWAANWAIVAHPSFAADTEAVKAAILAVKRKWDLEG